MLIKENYSLLSHNTFHLPAIADYFVSYSSVEELQTILNSGFLNDRKYFHIGGGSNLLFTSDFKGAIFCSDVKGYKLVKEDDAHVYLRVGAAEVWDDFVAYAVEHNWGGAENLSLIPGVVGSTPVQNIGAYGVEAKDLIFEVEAVELASGAMRKFSNADCCFGYRDSFFKQEENKNKFFITNVTYKLDKQASFNISYSGVMEKLKEKGEVSLKTIRETIIEIRESKLPDTEKTGNAGSFFMNPVIPIAQFRNLVEAYPEIPSYPASEGFVKLPAGWLIDKAGWKGKSHGKAGVHKDQALVLVNNGGATGAEIIELSDLIRADVEKKFGVKIYPEVIFL